MWSHRVDDEPFSDREQLIADEEALTFDPQETFEELKQEKEHVTRSTPTTKDA